MASWVPIRRTPRNDTGNRRIGYHWQRQRGEFRACISILIRAYCWAHYHGATYPGDWTGSRYSVDGAWDLKRKAPATQTVGKWPSGTEPGWTASGSLLNMGTLWGGISQALWNMHEIGCPDKKNIWDSDYNNTSSLLAQITHDKTTTMLHDWINNREQAPLKAQHVRDRQERLAVDILEAHNKASHKPKLRHNQLILVPYLRVKYKLPSQADRRLREVVLRAMLVTRETQKAWGWPNNGRMADQENRSSHSERARLIPQR